MIFLIAVDAQDQHCLSSRLTTTHCCMKRRDDIGDREQSIIH